MEYTTTKTEKHKVNASAECLEAISLYIKIEKLRDREERLEQELMDYVTSMPKEDLQHYVAVTDEYNKTH